MPDCASVLGIDIQRQRIGGTRNQAAENTAQSALGRRILRRIRTQPGEPLDRLLAVDRLHDHPFAQPGARCVGVGKHVDDRDPAVDFGDAQTVGRDHRIETVAIFASRVDARVRVPELGDHPAEQSEEGVIAVDTLDFGQIAQSDRFPIQTVEAGVVETIVDEMPRAIECRLALFERCELVREGRLRCGGVCCSLRDGRRRQRRARRRQQDRDKGRG